MEIQERNTFDLCQIKKITPSFVELVFKLFRNLQFNYFLYKNLQNEDNFFHEILINLILNLQNFKKIASRDRFNKIFNRNWFEV